MPGCTVVCAPESGILVLSGSDPTNGSGLLGARATKTRNEHPHHEIVIGGHRRNDTSLYGLVQFQYLWLILNANKRLIICDGFLMW